MNKPFLLISYAESHGSRILLKKQTFFNINSVETFFTFLFVKNLKYLTYNCEWLNSTCDLENFYLEAFNCLYVIKKMENILFIFRRVSNK